MKNEILLIINLFFTYSLVLVWLKLFGKKGLFCFTVLSTIAANIEVLILINAFGLEQTLGNILFASTFLVTDILSEISSKEDANKAVNIGIATSITFIFISQFWLLFTPSINDTVFDSIKYIFSNTPRLMLSSLAVYAISQKIDVWLYHKIWQYTNKLCGDKTKYLWLRNNASTLVSQLINTVLFTFFAFSGTYDFSTLINILFSSYLIYIITSLADTPFVYIARKITYKND
ncbi:MAG: queuosine precursor transporter [Oscillospiraceae bacterium]